jgi:hypothetical protein
MEHMEDSIMAMVPVYMTVPVGCDTIHTNHEVSTATAGESLWTSSGMTAMVGGDGTSIRERTSYYNCVGDKAAARFQEIIAERFPAVTVVVGEEQRRFRNRVVYRLHTYRHDVGPGHRDYIYVQGATRRSPHAFRPVDGPATAEAIKCKAVDVAAPGLVGEAAVMPDGAVIFAAHAVAPTS